jgi:hypothetical protein
MKRFIDLICARRGIDRGWVPERLREYPEAIFFYGFLCIAFSICREYAIEGSKIATIGLLIVGQERA